jgi:hypothetical protein
MTRALIIVASLWAGAAIGHTALTTALATTELTARAAEKARW